MAARVSHHSKNQPLFTTTNHYDLAVINHYQAFLTILKPSIHIPTYPPSPVEVLLQDWQAKEESPAPEEGDWEVVELTPSSPWHLWFMILRNIVEWM